jgi:hypothetical protein
VQKLQLAQFDLLHDRLALARPTLVIREAVEPFVLLSNTKSNYDDCS